MELNHHLTLFIESGDRTTMDALNMQQLSITTEWRETSHAGMNFAEGQNHFRNKKKRTSG